VPVVAALGAWLAAAAGCAEAPTARTSRRLQCGPTLDFTPVNAYAGALAAAVGEREDAVALINGSCTGTLVAAAAGPVVLTAGHCASAGDRVLVAFNVEAEPDGDASVTEATVIEQSDEPDYALLRLDRLPAVAPTPLTSRPSERLAVVQHPRGRPKAVAEGTFLGATDGQLSYADLDTLVGSSGAGVLTARGRLLGVHTDGDCTEEGGGANTGWTAEAIVGASAYLQSIDLEDGC
jgi:V8-like Glu-specific endopeptidase